MSWTDDFINTIQSHNNSDLGIQLAVMVSSNSCKIGELLLTSEDLLFNEHLVKQVATKVSGNCPADGGALNDTTTYISELKAGDTVAVVRTSNSDSSDDTSSLYIVLGKLVKL